MAEAIAIDCGICPKKMGKKHAEYCKNSENVKETILRLKLGWIYYKKKPIKVENTDFTMENSIKVENTNFTMENPIKVENIHFTMENHIKVENTHFAMETPIKVENINFHMKIPIRLHNVWFTCEKTYYAVE